MFEHFVVVGLHPHADVSTIESAYAARKAWENEENKDTSYKGPSSPALEPQVRGMGMGMVRGWGGVLL